MDAARSAESADADRLDALRRRLYAPDVTEEDVAAYHAAAAASALAVRPTPPPEQRGAPRRTGAGHGLGHGRVRAAVACGAVLLVAAALALVLPTRPLAGTTTAAASPAPSRSASGIAQTRVPAASSVRQQFVRSLQSGTGLGLLDYLYGHRAYLPAELRTTQRAASTEYTGQGSSTIALDPSDLAQHGGRLTVIVVLDRDATFSWAAERVDQGSGLVVELASHAGSGRAGEPVSSTFAYASSAPARLTMHVDDAVKWGAVVVFTD